MTETRELSQVAQALTQDELLGALLEMTGDLDKAQVLHTTVPGWMVTADAQVLRALHVSYVDSQRLRIRAERLLQRLSPLNELCAQRLEAFLLAKGVEAVDVEQDELELPKQSFSGVGPFLGNRLVESVQVEKHPLLQAALQNFSHAQAQTGGIPQNSLVRSKETGEPIPHLSAEQFVRYCRELDLGEVYQRHIREVFNLPAPDEVVDSTQGHNPAIYDIGLSRLMDMQIDLHIAYGKGDISAVAYPVLLSVLRADRPASEVADLMVDGKSLRWQGLNIGGACVWSVLVFADASFTGAMWVYMPNEPQRPWFEYASLADFRSYLVLRLKEPGYRGFFCGYLDESERLDFFARFEGASALGNFEWLAVAGNLSTFFFNACTGKIQLDALPLAVPVAQVDEEERQQRLEKYLEAGLTLLNIAGFVVPALGQLMMGVAVGQLLAEVYEGVEDLVHGERSEGLEHLINVAQNIAAMLVFAAGGRVVGSLKRSMSSSSHFFDRLVAVRRPDLKPRLWRLRLASYARSLPIDDFATANSQGVYQYNGHSYVKVRGALYAIAFDHVGGEWRILHPQRADAYRPVLTHNHRGGWLHDFEDPDDWEAVDYILRRLAPDLDQLPTGQVTDLAAITDLQVPQLRRMAKDGSPLPERFYDCVARVKQHRLVLGLREQLERQHTPDHATGRVQMLALPLMRGWPGGRFFELIDEHGNLLSRHPETFPFDYEDMSIHLTEQQLRSGRVMDTLLAALTADERETLLGGTYGEVEASKVLQRRLLATLKDNHQRVCEALYEDFDAANAGDHSLLKAHFPQLPNPVARELLLRTTAVDRWRLRRTGRIPLALAQRVREALDTQALERALSGLYFPQLATEETERVAVGLLGQMPDWPPGMLLKLRSGSLQGRGLAQIGDEEAQMRRTLVKTVEGFQAFDEAGLPLGDVATGPEGFYQAALNGLSPAQRRAMGMGGEQRAGHLRYGLIGKAQQQRAQVPRYLWPQRPQVEAAVPCLQAAPPAQVERSAPALVCKIRKLYPAMDVRRATTFAQQLGPDHLSQAKAAQALKAQFDSLHHALKAWRSDTESLSQLADPLWDYRLSRYQAMENIEACWKRLTFLADEQGRKVPGLSLDGMVLGQLPTLPAQVDFSHVQHLSLRNLRLKDDVAYFLKHFKGLRTLELSDNQLRRLPEVLSQMPHLERLYLSNNHLQLTEYTRTKLADLRTLKVLSLSNNPLLDPPDVTRMFDLRDLILRNCRLKSVPTALWRLPHLALVDLRENDITALPDWLYKAPRRLADAINLRHNPLDSPNRLQLSNYRRNHGGGMGFLEDDIARLNEQKARELWLADEGVPGYVEKNQAWNGLKDESGSDGLFKLLAELGGTADAQLVREDMHRRVWRVLDATAADTDLREEVFERAATPINCDDAAAVNFSSLEVLVEIREAGRLVEGGQVSARPLLRLGKGLFRLEQLESYARAHSAEHPSADPLEVSLAYRTGLADRFHLPGQPLHMRYARLGGVTQQALNAAETQLRTAELSPSQLEYLVKLPFWVDYLKRTFSRKFESLSQPYDVRMQAVFDQSLTLDDTDYRDQMNQVLREQEAVQKAEIVRLTEEALKLDDLGLCQRPLL